VHVPESHVQQRLQLGADLREVSPSSGVASSTVVSSRSAMDLPLNFTCRVFAIVAAAAAYVTRNVDIRQEVHFNSLQPVRPGTPHNRPPFHIEAETARLVTPLPAISGSMAYRSRMAVKRPV